jgi:type IV pilus assembly protein PilW
VISSILLGGVMTIMSSSKKTYTLQSELSALQDNARFLMDEFTYKIRMAGYSGCSATGAQTNTFGNSKDNIVAPDGLPVSDSLTILNYGELLPLAAEPTGNQIQLRSGFILPAGIKDIWVADCSIAPKKYSVTPPDPSSNSIIVDGSLDNFGGEIQVFNGQQETTYKVLYNPLGLYECQRNPDNLSACQNEDEFSMLIEGVESMQVRYGINNGSGIQFFPAPPNGKVVVVRISLLMRTPHLRKALNAINQSFYLDGPNLTYNPKDNYEQEEGYRHRLFTTTIAIRNSVM